MNQAIKVFVDLVLILTLIFLGVSITAGMAEVSTAKQTVNNAVVEIENSNFNKDVINSAISEINAKYNDTDEGVTVTVFEDDGSGASSHTGADVTDENIDNAVRVKVSLNYRYHVMTGDGTLHNYSSYSR